MNIKFDYHTILYCAIILTIILAQVVDILLNEYCKPMKLTGTLELTLRLLMQLLILALVIIAAWSRPNTIALMTLFCGCMFIVIACDFLKVPDIFTPMSNAVVAISFVSLYINLSFFV